jgi:hypothetical protein
MLGVVELLTRYLLGEGGWVKVTSWNIKMSVFSWEHGKMTQLGVINLFIR